MGFSTSMNFISGWPKFYKTISGLTLFVSKDGEAVVGANSLLSTDSFERVHISDAGSPLSTG